MLCAKCVASKIPNPGNLQLSGEKLQMLKIPECQAKILQCWKMSRKILKYACMIKFLNNRNQSKFKTAQIILESEGKSLEIP